MPSRYRRSWFVSGNGQLTGLTAGLYRLMQAAARFAYRNGGIPPATPHVPHRAKLTPDPNKDLPAAEGRPASGLAGFLNDRLRTRASLGPRIPQNGSGRERTVQSVL